MRAGCCLHLAAGGPDYSHWAHIYLAGLLIGTERHMDHWSKLLGRILVAHEVSRSRRRYPVRERTQSRDSGQHGLPGSQIDRQAS